MEIILLSLIDIRFAWPNQLLWSVKQESHDMRSLRSCAGFKMKLKGKDFFALESTNLPVDLLPLPTFVSPKMCVWTFETNSIDAINHIHFETKSEQNLFWLNVSRLSQFGA